MLPGKMNKIRNIRDSKGLTLDELGELMGTTGATVQRLETGKRRLTDKWLHRLRDALDVPLIELLEDPEAPVPAGLELKGEVRAGAWLELGDQQEADSPVFVNIMPDRRYSGARQYALRVVGNSMNKFVQPGSFVVVADWADLGLLEPRQDDVLVIRRQRAMTYEITLKRAKKGQNGWELWPESTDPRHQDPITLHDGEREVEVKIVALVVGRYLPS
jgi:transcriptional regulator with XRE-family HTH domain